MKIFTCKDRLEDIMTCIYDAWSEALQIGHDQIQLKKEPVFQQTIFDEYIHVDQDLSKAEKVIRSIRRDISDEAYLNIYLVTLSVEEEMCIRDSNMDLPMSVTDSNVVSAWDVLAGCEVSGACAVLGGGLVGTETAEFLAQKGLKVSIVEMLDQIATGESETVMPLIKKEDVYKRQPKIRGNFRSVPMERLLKEAQDLAEQGVKELILVAQETTLYGKDLYGEKSLPKLLRELCKISGIRWIRILYCYPEEITDELIQVMKEEPKICHYLDLPIQDVYKRQVTDRTCCGYAVLFWMCREDECKEDFSSVFGKYAESNFFSKPCGAGNSDV